MRPVKLRNDSAFAIPGAIAVVEGCGDHGCEYMTRGVAVILGPVGNNFGAGMTGGVAFVFDREDALENLLNPGTVSIAEPNLEQLELLSDLINEFSQKTGSLVAGEILDEWDELGKWIKCVKPKGDSVRPHCTKKMARLPI